MNRSANQYSLGVLFLILFYAGLVLGATDTGQTERGIGLIQVKIVDDKGQEVGLYGGSYALVIGVSDYNTKGWPKLPGVKKDVELVGAALTQNGFEVTTALDPDNVALDLAFGSFIQKHGGKADNRLLFYFAGHGYTVKPQYGGDPLGYIVPSNAPNPHDDIQGFKRIAMSMQRIEEYALGIDAKHVMFLFDSCFSGSLFSMTRDTPEHISYKTANPVRQFITAGSADEKVPDSSIFRSQFVEALNGEADTNKDGYITGAELGEFLQSKVANYSKGGQHPQYGKIRNPNLDKGDFVFVAGGSVVTDKEALGLAKGKKTGGLKVITRPDKAEVWVDGQAQGKAPVELQDLKPGSVMVKVVLSGYNEREKKVLISKGRVSQLTLLLDKIVTTGSLRVSSEPVGAEWYLDGAYVGVTPDIMPDLALGNHDVSVSLPGYEDYKEQITVTLGVITNVAATLTKKPVVKVVSAIAAQGVGGGSSSGVSGKSYTDPTTGMEFVFVPGGCFQMGDTFGDGERQEKPVHEVCLDGFYLGKYEVTQGQWQKIMGSNPAYFKKGDNFPVDQVSWDDVQGYISKLNTKAGKTFRLPTEAEWEYAARSGGKKEKWAGTSEKNRLGDYAWYDDFLGNWQTHAVGAKAPNGLGLYDMSGNVLEWCADWFDDKYYESSPRQNPTGASSGSFRVNRGMRWIMDDPSLVRSTARTRSTSGLRNKGLGFRLLLPLGQ